MKGYPNLKRPQKFRQNFWSLFIVHLVLYGCTKTHSALEEISETEVEVHLTRDI